MQKPLVSILMPFKNPGLYLGECITSIRAQSYTHWELWAIDDHSEDDSFKILSEFSKSDPRIHVEKSKGTGIIEALRQAFSQSKGDYITRMDSDDIMTKHKLKTMVSQLNDKGKNHVALGLVSYFSDSGISDGYAKYEKWLNRLTKTGSNYSEIYKECVIPSPCWMIHKNDLIRCGAFQPDRYPEDYDLTFRFYEHQITCIPSTELLHYWRDYASRTSRTHEHYAQNYFLDIKLHYFLKLDYIPKRPLTVWGAGYKGKTIAKGLIEKNIPFYWICDNPKKIGKDIYGETLRPFEFLKSLKQPQTIVTVANEIEQKSIVHYFETLKLKPVYDYFFFC